MVCKIFKNSCIGRLVLFIRCIVYLKYSCTKNVQKTCKNVQKRAKTFKNVHLKGFWTLFKNVHCQGPCILRPCISRPYCINHGHEKKIFCVFFSKIYIHRDKGICYHCFMEVSYKLWCMNEWIISYCLYSLGSEKLQTFPDIMNDLA